VTVIHFESPTLRVRYRAGLTIGEHGFPDWLPYARVAVRLPLVERGQGVDASRVVDVLTANAVLDGSGDPLWDGLPRLATPAGWTWAHLEMCRTIVLVPIELYLATRHRGGVATGSADPDIRGIDGCAGDPPPMIFHERLGDEPLALIEEHLGVLPEAYRRFVGATNGAAPAWPAVHPGFGFIIDQPLFGFARSDRMQDLGFTYAGFRDRLTAEFLPIGLVHGGLLAIRTSGGDAGSIWYYDSDDCRADADPLLYRCAGDFDTFWNDLRPVPAAIRSKAYAAADGTAWPVVLPRMGTSLPANARGPAVSA
jgi:hypothetical protein